MLAVKSFFDVPRVRMLKLNPKPSPIELPYTLNPQIILWFMHATQTTSVARFCEAT